MTARGIKSKTDQLFHELYTFINSQTNPERHIPNPTQELTQNGNVILLIHV